MISSFPTAIVKVDVPNGTATPLLVAVVVEIAESGVKALHVKASGLVNISKLFKR